MIDVDHFTYGFINPLYACVMSVLGCLLGLILAAKAQGRRSAVRTRLQVYATIAVAVTTIWVPQLIALLGFTVRPSAVRYEPWTLAASLGVTVVLVGAGLYVACLTTARRWRLLVGGAAVGAGIAAAHYGTMRSLRIGGTIAFDPNAMLTSVATELAVAAILVWCVMSIRSLLVAVGAAVFLGAGLTATQYLAIDSVRVHMNIAHPPFVGVTALQLVAPVITLGSGLLAMLWFFTVGSSTRGDLKAVFESPDHSIEIEPWLLQEVADRVSDGVPRAEAEAAVALALTTRLTLPTAPARRPNPRRAARSAPRTAPSWRGMPVLGTGRPRPVGTANGRGRPGGAGPHGNLRVEVRWLPVGPATTRHQVALAAGGDVAAMLAGGASTAVEAAAAGGAAETPALVAAINPNRGPASKAADEGAVPAHRRSRWRNRRG